MPTYTIKARGKGIEFAMERISEEAYKYWTQSSRTVLRQYLLEDVDDDTLNLDPEHSMSSWYQMTYYNGPVASRSPELIVTQDGNEIWQEVLNEDLVNEDPEELESQFLEGHYVVVFFHEKGTFIDEDIEDTEFDRTALQFCWHKFRDQMFLESMTYKGQELTNISSSLMGGNGPYIEFVKIEKDGKKSYIPV